MSNNLRINPRDNLALALEMMYAERRGAKPLVDARIVPPAFYPPAVPASIVEPPSGLLEPAKEQS